jgi:hypothetical protein
LEAQGGRPIRILENDGSYITVEILDPKWSVAQVEQRHHNRCATLMRDYGIQVGPIEGDDWVDAELDYAISGERGTYRRMRPAVAALMMLLPRDAITKLDAESTGDHRERVGCDRNDGKQLVARIQKLPFEKFADKFGIPTNETAGGPWRDMVLAAIRDAEVKGAVQ